MNGVFAVAKPAGRTSFDVVAAVRSIIALAVGAKPKTIKVGHGGTLDKNARGVLVLGVGTNGCRRLNALLHGDKQYAVTGCLGTRTDTGDTGGSVTHTMPFAHISQQSMESALSNFTGEIMQRPPVFSALKIKGKRFSDLAREGVHVEPEPRKVVVHSLRLTHFEPPRFELNVHCGHGTYMRSLVDDLGRALGSVAYVTDLNRLRQSNFDIADALREEDWTWENIRQRLDSEK